MDTINRRVRDAMQADASMLVRVNPNWWRSVRFGVELCLGGPTVDDEARLTITLDREIYESLLDSTSRRKPRLTKRFVVELALTRLFEELRQGQLELGFNSDRRK